MKRSAILALAVIAQNAHAQASVEEPAIVAVVTAVFDGMRKSDSASVRPLFHPKARLLTVDSRNPTPRVQESADAFIQFIGTSRPEVLDERVSNIRVFIDGTMASVWADYRLYRGTTFIHCGVDHFLLVKEIGAWRIIELADTRRQDCGATRSQTSATIHSGPAGSSTAA